MTGLPGAGKTSFAHVLATGSFDPATLPSRAHTYDMTTITKEGFALKVWDVARGGAFQTRWERYCRNCRAVVFVFDASDRDVSHITDAREALHDLMRRSTLHNVPLLVLGNKSDRKNAMTAGECADALRLDDVRDDDAFRRIRRSIRYEVFARRGRGAARTTRRCPSRVDAADARSDALAMDVSETVAAPRTGTRARRCGSLARRPCPNDPWVICSR